MKPITRISVLIFIIFSLIASNSFAQKKVVVVKERHQTKKVVVVNKRHHLFRKTVVYHPYWAPRVNYSRRWVYFPRYNFYWDNFRSVYVIRTGTVWVTSSNTPKELENIDLSKEKSVELSEDNDNKARSTGEE